MPVTGSSANTIRKQKNGGRIDPGISADYRHFLLRTKERLEPGTCRSQNTSLPASNSTIVMRIWLRPAVACGVE